MGERETRLTSMVISSTTEANEIFGGKHSANETPIMLIPTRRFCCPFITVPSGMYALVQVAGQDMDYEGGPRDEGGNMVQYGSNSAVWPPGFHFASPCPCNEKRISHLVTKQAVVFDTPIRGCKTKDDVTVTIDVCLSFRIMGDVAKGEDPALVRTFVHKLGPVELGKQLKDAQDERVRALARSVKHTEVYALRSASAKGGDGKPYELGGGLGGGGGGGGETKPAAVGGMAAGIEMTAMGQPKGEAVPASSGDAHVDVTEDMKHSLNAQFQKYGVEIIDVAIQRVRLPPDFEKQMEEKTTYEAVIEEQKMRQMSEMQIIKQAEEKLTVNQKHKEDQEREQELGTKLVADEKKKLDSVVAETNKLVAEIREQESAEVRTIKAESDLIVQKLESETQQILVEHDAKAKAECEKIKADADAYVMTKAAEASLVEAKNAAQAKKIKAEAEGKAAEALRKKRQFELQKQQIAMYSALAENNNVVVTGKNSGQSLLADMMMSQKQSQIMLNVDPMSR